jgi:hypothetical protein
MDANKFTVCEMYLIIEYAGIYLVSEFQRLKSEMSLFSSLGGLKPNIKAGPSFITTRNHDHDRLCLDN